MLCASSLFLNRHHDVETGLLLPLRDVALLPGTTLPVVAGKPRSVAVAESAAKTANKQVIVAAIRPQALQKLTESEIAREDSDQDSTRPLEVESIEEIYSMATLAVVHKMIPLPMGLVQLIVEGLERVEIVKLVQKDPTYAVKFKKLPALTVQNAVAKGTDEQTLEALTQAIKSLWAEGAAINPRFPQELLAMLLNTPEPAKLAYQTSLLLQQDVITSQAILEEEDLEIFLEDDKINLLKGALSFSDIVVEGSENLKDNVSNYISEEVETIDYQEDLDVLLEGHIELYNRITEED